MFAIRKHITIKDPKCTVLTDLPFRPGQRVEIVIVAEENGIDTDHAADAVRAKLAALGIGEQDVKEAMRWARDEK